MKQRGTINIDNPGTNGVKPYLFTYRNWSALSVRTSQLEDRELRVVSQGTTLSGLIDVYPFVLNSPQQFSDGDHSFTGSLDVPKGNPYERACWLLDDLNRAFLYTPGDPGNCTITWSPTSTDGTKFSPADEQVHLNASDPISSDTSIHEYGHNVMYTQYHGSMPPHPNCNPHHIETISSAGCAWTEGWADFFPLAVNNDPIYHLEREYLSSIPIDTDYDIENGTGAWQNAWAAFAAGDTCEGRVAGALWDLKDDTPNEVSDWYSFGFNPIWNAMVNNRAVVNNFNEFWNIWLGQGNSFYAANCLLQNTIDYWPSKSIALCASNGQYVCADGGGGYGLIANRDWIGAWETFKLIDLGNGNVALRASNGQYVCALFGGGDGVVADRPVRSTWETFGLINLGSNNVALRANNGKYIVAEFGGGDGVFANRDWIGAWETFKRIDLGNGKIALQANNNKYVCAVDGGGGAVVADRNAVNAWETFGLTQVSLSFAQSDENLTIENGKASISEGEGSVCASC